MHEILRLAKQHDAVVATGHVDLPELFALADACRELGVKLVMTHALETQVGADHTLAHAVEMADRGAMIEFTYLTCMPGGFAATHDPATFARAMAAVGPARAIMSTDFGQDRSPHPAVGMQLFIDEMLRAGLTAADVDLMARRNPARLLQCRTVAAGFTPATPSAMASQRCPATQRASGGGLKARRYVGLCSTQSFRFANVPTASRSMRRVIAPANGRSQNGGS